MAKTSSPASTPGKPKLRVAFIGAGGIAGYHLNYLSKMDDVQIVGLADISRANMDRHAKTYNIPVDNCHEDWKQMLAHVKPDAVSVCTSNGAHAPATIDALNAGAHVLVEKPMAMNAREAQAMIDAANKNKKKLVIGFQYRYDAKTQYIKRAIDEGQFGKIMYARVQALRRRGIPNWGVFGRKELQGGGPMIDIGVHALEMTHYAMGSPRPVAAFGATFTYMGDKKSDTVSAWGNWDYKTYTVEDLAVGQIRFDNGAILSIEASFVAHIEKDMWTFSLMGEKAGCTWDPPMIYKDDGGYMVNSTPNFLPTVDHFQVKMRNWVEHVHLGKPTGAPAEHGLMVQKMLDGVYESAAKKREVKID